MTIPPVITPLLQWADANGTPYANGTITTYIVGTGTPKTTWADPDQSFANQNPLRLDAAGRSQMWGDGDYRLVLHDSANNLIADFAATTLVSAAMYPVVSAPTIADAVSAMGIDTLISDEATARANADSAEQNARIAADANLQSEIDTANGNIASAFNALSDEINRAVSAENHLQAEIDTINATVASHPSVAITIQAGTAFTDLSGHIRITFPIAFPTAWTSFTCSVIGTATDDMTVQATADVFGADVYALRSGILATTVVNFSWFATGN